MSVIFISGLRRSGTTIFWKTFRQDTRFLAFNEPFSPEIRKVADSEWRSLPDFCEFRELMLKNPYMFWQKYAPIRCTEELQSEFSDRQRTYLEFLFGSSKNVLIDDTHCQFKLEALKRIDPSMLFIHLYRPPQKFATSIMLPSRTNIPRHHQLLINRTEAIRDYIKRRMNRTGFWKRNASGNAWGFDEIMEPISPHSVFGIRLMDAGMDPDLISELPAVGKLLAYWKINFEYVRSTGPEVFEDRFLSVNLDNFLQDPQPVVRSIYHHLGLPVKSLDVSSLRKPSKVYNKGNSKWKELLTVLEMENWIAHHSI